MHLITPSVIQSYSLFGESTHLPDVLHCETIAERSVLHDWELALHRHTRLHQVLLIRSGGGMAHLDGKAIPLGANVVVNVPPEHVHAFRFTHGTHQADHGTYLARIFCAVHRTCPGSSRAQHHLAGLGGPTD
jgi:AraC family transcriptional activator of pobA